MYHNEGPPDDGPPVPDDFNPPRPGNPEDPNPFRSREYIRAADLFTYNLHGDEAGCNDFLVVDYMTGGGEQAPPRAVVRGVLTEDMLEETGGAASRRGAELEERLVPVSAYGQQEGELDDFDMEQFREQVTRALRVKDTWFEEDGYATVFRGEEAPPVTEP